MIFVVMLVLPLEVVDRLTGRASGTRLSERVKRMLRPLGAATRWRLIWLMPSTGRVPGLPR